MTRTPKVGEVWTVHSRRDRQWRTADPHSQDIHNYGTRTIVNIAEGLVTFWHQYPGSGGSIPGVKTVHQFCEESRPPCACPTCGEPAPTDSDPCAECWAKADAGAFL